jgi:hypothetical protein
MASKEWNEKLGNRHTFPNTVPANESNLLVVRQQQPKLKPFVVDTIPNQQDDLPFESSQQASKLVRRPISLGNRPPILVPATSNSSNPINRPISVGRVPVMSGLSPTLNDVNWRKLPEKSSGAKLPLSIFPDNPRANNRSIRVYSIGMVPVKSQYKSNKSSSWGRNTSSVGSGPDRK